MTPTQASQCSPGQAQAVLGPGSPLSWTWLCHGQRCHPWSWSHCWDGWSPQEINQNLDTPAVNSVPRLPLPFLDLPPLWREQGITVGSWYPLRPSLTEKQEEGGKKESPPPPPPPKASSLRRFVGVWGVFAFQSRGPWTLLRSPEEIGDDKYLYLQRQMEQTLPPSPLPFQSFLYPSPSRPPRSEPSSARWGHCLGHPTPPPQPGKEEQGGAG